MEFKCHLAKKSQGYFLLWIKLNKKYVESILIKFFGSFGKREVKSLSIDEKELWEINQLDLFGFKINCNSINNKSDIEEDKETQDCSESTNDALYGQEFTQELKSNQEYWEFRTKSMKKRELVIPFKSSFLSRRSSM